MAIQTLTCWHTYATQKEDKNKTRPKAVFYFYSGAPRRIRTLNLLIRSQMLYPIEPWAQCSIFYTLLFDLQEKTQLFLSVWRISSVFIVKKCFL